MAEWKFKLRIGEEFELANKSIQLAAKGIAEKISSLLEKVENDDWYNELEDILYDSEILSEDNSATTEEFDALMERLYDWGDLKTGAGWPSKRLCWIESSPSRSLEMATQQSE